jgi:ABC-type oligopeptide transport system ATPase subunit
VDGVSFCIQRGETLWLLGESGCGKTTVGKTVLRLIEPTSGEIWLKSKDITYLRGTELRPVRREMQMIFQDPYSSLTCPRVTSWGNRLKIMGLQKEKKKSAVSTLAVHTERNAATSWNPISRRWRRRTL